MHFCVSVCVCVCFCVYMPVYMHACTCIYKHVNVYTYFYVGEKLICMGVSVFACKMLESAYACMSLNMYTCE